MICTSDRYTRHQILSHNDGRYYDLHLEKRYKHVSMIGQGSYSTVFHAYDTVLEKSVAIKCVYDAFNITKESVRTIRELTCLRKFNHPNIVSLITIDIPTPDLKLNINNLHIIMEYVPHTLHDMIRNDHKNLNVQHIMYQILNAVKYMHCSHIIHRDLKPANILITDSQKIKLCDFNLTRSLHSFDFNKELSNYIVTRWYRAPEILYKSDRYSEKIDIWSLGCIMTEMLTGRILFKGSTEPEMLLSIFNFMGVPENIENVLTNENLCARLIQEYKFFPANMETNILNMCPQLSLSCIDLLTRMLHIDPDKRISANDALLHPYFYNYIQSNDDRYYCTPFKLEFDIYCNDEMRRLILYEAYLSNDNRHNHLML